MDEISERVRAVRMMSLRTDATVHLGTPHRAPDGHIYTSALSIHRGAIAGATYKSMLYPIEEEMGMTRANPKANQHVRDNGTALAICSDLICTKYEFSDQERQRARRLFGLTAWAYTEGNNEDLIEKAGGEDAYYQEQLEKVIGGYVLPYLPNVTSVVIADEGRPDLAPYNAAFSRQY